MIAAMELTLSLPPLWAVLAVIAFVLFFAGALPIPVGYERGKVAWLMWCGTGMHAHIVYRTDDHGFQTLHPKDKSEGVR